MKAIDKDAKYVHFKIRDDEGYRYIGMKENNKSYVQNWLRTHATMVTENEFYNLGRPYNERR